MKRILTLMLALVAVIGIQAQGKINLHLTGCTSAAGNPTEFDEDEMWVSLTFDLESGYTFAGAEVSVKYGDTELSDDFSDPTGCYMLWDNELSIMYYDDVEEDFDVTIICKKEQTGPELPAVFSPATFEDLEIPEDGVYRPGTFEVGDNKWLSGAARFNTNVVKYGDWIGYMSTQAVSYKEGTKVQDYSDAYLPSAAGAAEGNNYATIYIMDAFEKINFTKTTLSGVAVTNTAVNVSAFLNGDGMSIETIGDEKKYGLPFHQDDWFLLTIKGLDGETVTGTIDYYLADYRTPGDWKYAKNWQWVDLSSLGEIDGLQFELSSTKHNTYGMSTSAYFCIDNLGGQASNCKLGAMTAVVPEVDFNDDAAYEVSTEYVAQSVNYTRSTTTNWGTVCLPYEVKSNDDIQYYELVGATTDELTFKPVDEVAAGQPAVFKKLASGSDVEISAKNVVLKPASQYSTTAETTPSNWIMKGTLTGTSIQGMDKYFIAQNMFWIAEDETGIKPYRGWFETTTPGNTRNMTISVVEGGATSILTIDGNGNLTEGDVYDLSGRKVSANAKGIVIQNRKLIIK